MDCLFCKIAKKEQPADIVYETDTVVAFKDIHPKAPTHILVIPKRHIDNIMGVSESDTGVLAGIVTSIQQIAKELGLESRGFRVVANTGKEGGQTVDHLHFHLLGGRSLMWPPG